MSVGWKPSWRPQRSQTAGKNRRQDHKGGLRSSRTGISRPPRLHGRPRQGLREAGPLTTASTAAQAGAGRSPGFSTGVRRIPRLPRRQRRLLEPSRMAAGRVVSGPRVGRSPPPRPILDASHVRELRDSPGVSLFYLARLMGSSVEQIDRTYGHLLPESEDYLRGLLDDFDLDTARADVSPRGL